MRALQWLKIFAAVFIMKINKNNSRFKVSLAMKIIFFEKWGFWPFFANTDRPSYKGIPFYFSKMILFLRKIFSDQKELIKNSFWAHKSKIKVSFDTKNWLKKVSPIYRWLFEFSALRGKFSTKNVLDILNFSSLSH